MNNFRIVGTTDIESVREGLLKCWQQNLNPNYLDSRIDWLYRDNPRGPAYTCLALSGDNNEIVGCGSLYPWTFYCKGKAVRVGVATDFGVDKSFRAFGPALVIQKDLLNVCNKKIFDIAFVYPNKESSGVFKRAGYTPIGYSIDWVRVLKSKGILFQYIKSPVLNKLLIPLLDNIISLMHWILYRVDYKQYSGVILDRCSKDFDDLWEREKMNYVILQDKTSEYLNWRYSENTSRDYRYYCLYDKDKILKGFILYFVESDEVHIKDIFPANGRWINPLLWNFINIMKSQDVNTIRLSFYGCDAFKKLIRRYGFIEGKTGRDYMFFFPIGAEDELLTHICNHSFVYLFFG